MWYMISIRHNLLVVFWLWISKVHNNIRYLTENNKWKQRQNCQRCFMISFFISSQSDTLVLLMCSNSCYIIMCCFCFCNVANFFLSHFLYSSLLQCYLRFMWPCCRGISDEALELSDLHCSIPMKGMVDSFNVSVAAGIVMHHAVCDRTMRLVILCSYTS